MTLDLLKTSRDALREHNLSPADIFDRMTPHQIAMVFFKTGGGGSGKIDRETALKDHNAIRAKQKLPPMIPSWMWPEIPRKG